MCIVVDTNTVAALLDKTNALHQEFKPVLDWILGGKGKFVYGGTVYLEEVFKKMTRFNRLFAELVKRRKVILLPSNDVDEEMQRVRSLEPSPDFDDPHIVAIVEVSGCLLLCSKDSRADKYIKRKRLYRKSAPPKIYRKARYHTGLLADDNIAECCNPSCVLDKNDRSVIGAHVEKLASTA